jgi:putative spermidine/putrescine transport system permease protein
MSSAPTSNIHRLASALYRRPKLRLALLLGVPLFWMVGVYGGSLAALLVQSFFRLDSFSGTIDRSPTLATWRDLFTDANMSVAARTIGMASSVTLASIVIALPLAYFIARHASRRTKAVLGA